MAAKFQKKKRNEKTRIIVLTIIGVVAFLVSVIMNVIGMRNAINKAPDSSGMEGFSVRTIETEDLNTKKENTKTEKKDENGTYKENDFLVNALPIVSLNNNNWDRVKAKLNGFELDGDGNAFFKEGYTLYCNGKYVNYIVFHNIFEKEVVGHLKVGEDLKEVEKTLGTPTFQDKGKTYLGYKSRENYVFFYKNEIVVYPNRNFSNRTLEELFQSYFEKSYEKGRTYFLVDIRNNYEDFTIDLEEETDTITITSITRQVIAKLDGLGNIEVTFYNGYKLANDMTKEYIKDKIFIQKEEDLVEITESERVRGK